MTDEEKEVIPISTTTETALDVAAFVGSAVPWIGGPVSNVLGGMSLGRKLGRVCEVLEGLSDALSDFKSEVSESYVSTDEFEELLEQTLRRVGDERNEEKRHLYKAFITNAIESPGEPYDDQIRLLRTFEELIPDHLRVLKAMSQIPNPDPGMTGSPNQTLSERLPEFDGQQIELLINELNGMRLTNLASLKVLMTGRGASDLRNAITDYGNRILNYIREAKNKRGR